MLFSLSYKDKHFTGVYFSLSASTRKEVPYSYLGMSDFFINHHAIRAFFGGLWLIFGVPFGGKIRILDNPEN